MEQNGLNDTELTLLHR